MTARSFASAWLAALCWAGLAGPALAGSPMPEGYPGRGRIGVEVQAMTAELREFFAAPASHGVLIVRVEKGRPAEAADLRVGDVVIAAAGEPLVRPHDLIAVVARAQGGAPLELTVVRDKHTRTIEVVPEGEPATAAALEAWHERSDELSPAPSDLAPADAPGADPAAPDAETAPDAAPATPEPAPESEPAPAPPQ